MPTNVRTGPLICPECGRTVEAVPGAPVRTDANRRWCHRDDGSPLCPTTPVRPVTDTAVVPHIGWYGPTATIQASTALRDAASYLEHALAPGAAPTAVPHPDDLTRLLSDLHQATSRLAGAVAYAARHAPSVAGMEATRAGAPRPTVTRLLAARLTDASALLTLAGHTLCDVRDGHRHQYADPAAEGTVVDHAPAAR